MADFNLEFNGLVFVKSTFPLQRLEGYVITIMDGVYSPPVRTTSEERTATSGGNIYRQEYGPRIINFEGIISSKTPSNYFGKISALSTATRIVKQDLPIKITRWDGESLIAFGRVLEPPSPEEVGGMATRAEFRMSLYCSVPFFFDNTEQLSTAFIASGGGGFVPFGIPGILGARQYDGTEQGEAIVNNQGDVNYWATLTLHGNISNAVITNLTTGEYFAIDGEINAGDSLEIRVNADGLRVLLNGQTNYRSKIIGDIFQIVPGVNIIKLDGINIDGNASLDVSFRTPYLTLAK